LVVGYVGRKTTEWMVLFARNRKAGLARVRVTDAYW
jgi:hypothetical protein